MGKRSLFERLRERTFRRGQ